jgi:hypothetical protein
VPGLIFLSGQTPVGKDGKVVDGGIAEHTVSVFDPPPRSVTAIEIVCDPYRSGSMYKEPKRCLGGGRIKLGEGCQSECLSQGHGYFCRDEQSLRRGKSDWIVQ